MMDRPILFSAPMVRALLADSKTQTRRVLNPQPDHLQVYDWNGKRLHDSPYRHWCWKGHVGADNWDDITRQLSPFLPYAVGDRLYVREAWRTFVSLDKTAPRDLLIGGRGAGISFKAGGGLSLGREPERAYTYCETREDENAFGKFRQGMHMPRWASRLTLPVCDVRVQRLQEISEADAIAEGIERVAYDGPDPEYQGVFGWKAYDRLPDGSEHPHNAAPFANPVRSYRSLWDSLNAERDDGAYAWAANPWVVAVTFSVINQNIDQVKP